MGAPDKPKLPKLPKPPPIVQQPMQQMDELIAQSRDRRRQAAVAAGRRSTIATGPAGVQGEATLGTRTLLGSG